MPVWFRSPQNQDVTANSLNTTLSMSIADRFAVLAAITSAIAWSEGRSSLLYVTIGLLWWTIIELSTEIRAERRKAAKV